MSNSYKRSKKLRKHLHDKMVEFWSDDENIKKQQKRLKKKMKELGKDTGINAKQQLRGVRDEEGYREYMFLFQQKFRREHPNYYKYLQRYRRDKKKGKFKGTFKEWQIENGVKA